MTDIEATVRASYLGMLGQEPKADVVARWATDLAKGGRSLEDFHRYLMRTREYEQHVTYTFKKLYVQLVDENVDVDQIKNLRAFAGNQPITEAVIVRFLRTTDAYLDKYRQVVASLWRVLKGVDIPEHVAAAYIARFRGARADADAADGPSDADEYTVEQLQADMLADKSHDNVLAVDGGGSSFPIADIAEVVGAGVSVADFSKVLDIMRSPRLAAELYLASKDLTKHPKINALVHLYPSVYDREVTVVELLRMLPTLLATNDIGAYVRGSQQAFARAFAAIDGVYRAYLGRGIDDMFFIKNHLAALDETDLSATTSAYVGGVVDAIIRGDEYAAAVRAKLDAAFVAHNPGAPAGGLLAADAEQLMCVLLASRVPATDDERIDAVLVDYFRGMDAFVAAVRGAYDDNLGRALEPDEEAAFRAKFRAHDTDLNAVVADVRASFEFVTVVHQLVDSIAKDLGVDAGKGRLFKVIETLLGPATADKSKLGLCMQARALLTASQ